MVREDLKVLHLFPLGCFAFVENHLTTETVVCIGLFVSGSSWPQTSGFESGICGFLCEERSEVDAMPPSLKKYSCNGTDGTLSQ